MRLCSSAQSSLGSVVTIAKLRTHSPAGDFQFSHKPASAPAGKLLWGSLIVHLQKVFDGFVLRGE